MKKLSRRHFDEANRDAAEIILRDPERYGGPELRNKPSFSEPSTTVTLF
jgi:hypothetical protein